MNFGKKQCVGVLLLGLIWGVSAGAADIYVDDTAPGANNGSSWFNAYRYLQDALQAAQPGDAIKVAQGTYKPNLATAGPINTRYATFNLINGVSLMGGYAGYSNISPTPPDTRNTKLFPSILSGDLNGNDSPVDINELHQMLSDTNRQENSFTVVTASATEPNAVLDGFFVKGGTSNGDSTNQSLYEKGGGLAAIQGYATIRHCVFRENAAAAGGGGIYSYHGSIKVENCTISHNFGDVDGGGVTVWRGSPHYSTCDFEGNVVGFQGTGGALYNFEGKPKITECTFTSNDGGRNGGAISNSGDSLISQCTFTGNYAGNGGAIETSVDNGHPRIEFSRFIGNQSGTRGGALYAYRSNPQVKACHFIGNDTGREGGAMAVSRGDPNVTNCVFNGNVCSSTNGAGGGLHLHSAVAKLINCTFTHNSALNGDSIACESSGGSYVSDLDIRNSILRDGANSIFINDGSSMWLGYNTMSDYYAGPGNSVANPQFVDAIGPDTIPGTDDDDLRLKSYSPAIDAGNNNYVPAGVILDADQGNRFVDNPDTPDTGIGTPPIVDRGAYEWGSSPGGGSPIADAGTDTSVIANQGGTASVTLDGSGSYFPPGSTAQVYQWLWSGGSASGVSPTVTLAVGTHIIQLKVWNGLEWSAPDNVTIIVQPFQNQKPVANAGNDDSVQAGPGGTASYQLNGSGSYFPPGSTTQYYQWTWTGGSASGVTPTVTLPVGTHVITLTVWNGLQWSDPDQVTITVTPYQNPKPTADAGDDDSVYAEVGGTASYQLDGSGSTFPPGSTTQYYQWTWNGGSATGVSPTVVLPVGTHVITLTVWNGLQWSDPDQVTITVLPYQNPDPTADAGEDDTVYAGIGGTASYQLDGSGSYFPSGSTTQYYYWTWSGGYATGVSPTVSLPVGSHVISLRVHNGIKWSNVDTVTITVLPQYNFDTWIYPGVITPHDSSPYVMMLMDIVGIPSTDIDMNVPLRLSTGNLAPIGQHLTVRNTGNITATIFAFWHETQVLAAHPGNGPVTLTVTGRLKNGNPFTGSAQVTMSH